MSVYKHRNSPNWQYDFQIGGYRFTGSTEIETAKPKREAKAVETEQRRKAQSVVAEIKRANRQPMTVAVACDRWWTEVGQHLEESDLKTSLAWLRDQLGPRRLLHDISADDVTRAITERRKHVVKAGRTDKGVQLYRPISARTINRTVPKLLRRVIRRAAKLWKVVILQEPEWGELLLAETKRPIAELTLAGEAALDDAERADYAAFRQFTTIMGLRLEEGLLTWPQVDFDQAEIRIVGKGGKPAVLPLTKEAYAILWSRKGHHPTWVFTYVAQKTRRCPKTKQDYVRGQRYPLTYWGVTSHRRRHWKKAGVTSRWHDLRHTTGRRVLRASGNLKVVQRLLRHSDIGTTAQFYADVLIEDIRAGMESAAEAKESRKEPRSNAAASSKTLKR